MVKQTPPWFSWLELVVVGALAPWFLVPSLGFRIWMMVIPMIFWGLRLIISGKLTIRTPLKIPILAMGTMLGMSALVTFDRILSLPKAVGIFYGIIVYFALTNNLSWNFTKRIVLPTLLAGGFVMAGLSLFGMQTIAAKLPLIGSLLQQIVKSIPKLLTDIPRAEAGISTNQLGGTLILLIPMQATLFIYTVKERRGKPSDWIKTVVSGIGFCITLFVLLLTQSRGAIAAILVVISMFSLFYLRTKRWLIITLLVVSLVLGVALIFDPQADKLFSETELAKESDSFDLKSRPEIWSRAYRMLQDHPFTGIGLDTFSVVLSTRYPTFQTSVTVSRGILHAHNLYLQTALDLGIPGLIAFLALHAIVGWMLIRTVRCSDSPLVQATAIGLILGLVAQLIYGWIDCIALGQKPSIFFWMYLALSTVVYKSESENPEN